MTKPDRIAATDSVRGSNSSDRGRRPAAAFAGAVALLAVGGAAATFLIGGDQTRAEATDAPQAALAAMAQQLPVRTVKTVTIKADPQPKTTKVQPRPVAPQPPADVAVETPVDAEAPPREDPRWARAPEAPASQPIPLNAPIDLTPSATGLALSALAAAEEPSDPMSTAAIYRNDERARDQLSAMPPELAIPEPQMPVTDETPAAEERPAPQRTVRVNDGVNLRARGASGSRVLRTIPANASVGLVGCKAWCEVVYDGTRGFIYKSFVGGPRAPAARATAKPAEQAPAAPDSAKEAPAAQNTAEAKASDWTKVRER